jgi:hypothetical protein
MPNRVEDMEGGATDMGTGGFPGVVSSYGMLWSLERLNGLVEVEGAIIHEE